MIRPNISNFAFIIWLGVTLFIIQGCKQESAIEVIDNEDSITVNMENYTLAIEKDGFRYEFRRPDGKVIASAHEQSGIRFGLNGENDIYDVEKTSLVSWNEEEIHILVENSNQDNADVRIFPFDTYVKLAFTPRSEGKYGDLSLNIIDFRTAPINPVYGMGDHGAQSDSTRDPRDKANVFGLVRDDITNDDVNNRFISNFAVFPAQGFAQVLFEEGRKRVGFTVNENRIGVANVESIDKLYYFIGNMHQIYADYKQVRESEGYEDAKPKYEMFGLGWEAYGALSWDTNQRSVMDMLQTYFDHGYRFHWGVVGSGFWKGARDQPDQGATISFGIWDDTFEPGRDDGHPNPRYPDVAGLKTFFKENNMKLLLGLRNHFKALPDDGGYYNNENDGFFTVEGLRNDYYMKDKAGIPLTVTGIFPAGNLYLLESNNEEALKWYKEGADLWGVDGYKEDAMIRTKTYRDGNWNRFNIYLQEAGYYIIVRNTAYSVPGDIMRIDDTRYEHGREFFKNPDRIPINMLNFAASGAANVYPDITGAAIYGITSTDPRYQKYLTRNAVYNAVTPSMSMGRGPWTMEYPEYEEIVLKAAQWHNKYAPYIYSAAIDSYNSGFPYTMTPLHIAFPEDENTYELVNTTNRQYQWMLGPSMMATPVFGNDFDTANSRDVYLPEGKWMDYETGQIYKGPKTLKNYALPMDKIPIFIGGKGIVVFENQQEAGSLYAQVYPITNDEVRYTFTYKDGLTTSEIYAKNNIWNRENIRVIDINEAEAVPVEYIPKNGSIKFNLKSGHNYRISAL